MSKAYTERPWLWKPGTLDLPLLRRLRDEPVRVQLGRADLARLRRGEAVVERLLARDERLFRYLKLGVERAQLVVSRCHVCD